MPIQKRWSKFTKEKISSVPEAEGVYELGDTKGEVVDIGSGDGERGIKSRLENKKNTRPTTVKKFRYKLTSPSQDPKKEERKLGEAFERRHGRLPRLQKRLPRKR